MLETSSLMVCQSSVSFHPFFSLPLPHLSFPISLLPVLFCFATSIGQTTELYNAGDVIPVSSLVFLSLSFLSFLFFFGTVPVNMNTIAASMSWARYITLEQLMLMVLNPHFLSLDLLSSFPLFFLLPFSFLLFLYLRQHLYTLRIIIDGTRFLTLLSLFSPLFSLLFLFSIISSAPLSTPSLLPPPPSSLLPPPSSLLPPPSSLLPPPSSLLPPPSSLLPPPSSLLPPPSSLLPPPSSLLPPPSSRYSL